MLTVVIIFLFITLGSAFSLSSIVYRQSAMVRNNEHSTQSMFAAESLQEDILYRLLSNKKVSAVESISMNAAVAEALVEDRGGDLVVISTGDANKRIRKSEMIVTSSGSVGFSNGVLAGRGGVVLSGGNNDTIVGDVYSNGPVIGSGGVRITGNVVSAGPNGLIRFANKYSLFIDGSAHAHNIENTWASGDAFYTAITDSRIDGNQYPNSPDMPLLEPMISDEMIESWKTLAEEGAVYSACPYNIKGAWQGVNEIGNIRINCDLNVGSDAKVKITGPVWVNGNINLSGGATVELDPALGVKTIPVIADNISNKAGGGIISASGGVKIMTSNENAFLLLISQNESASRGGNVTAINASGGSTGGNIIFYANHGKVKVSAGSQVPVVAVGYRMEISGGAKIRYTDSAADLDLPDAPSAEGFSLKSLREIQ